jgi:hypothetical protein
VHSLALVLLFFEVVASDSEHDIYYLEEEAATWCAWAEHRSYLTVVPVRSYARSGRGFAGLFFFFFFLQPSLLYILAKLDRLQGPRLARTAYGDRSMNGKRQVKSHMRGGTEKR